MGPKLWIMEQKNVVRVNNAAHEWQQDELSAITSSTKRSNPISNLALGILWKPKRVKRSGSKPDWNS
eukprot:8887546-Pyramimonas_sp.AAC.1